jgi:hypothetical protein
MGPTTDAVLMYGYHFLHFGFQVTLVAPKIHPKIGVLIQIIAGRTLSEEYG